VAGGLFKSSIGNRIFIFTVIPFVCIYGVISLFIGQSVLRDKIRQMKIDVKTVARFNETNLRSYIENVKLGIDLAVVQLENLDSRAPGVREAAEAVLSSCFENRQIYNGWFVFEPGAFDGRTADYRGGYPGAPSGWFMRSFIRGENGEFPKVPDMDESVIDNPEGSYWYTISKQSGRRYININGGEPFYDYQIGEGKVISVSIVCPVFRGGAVIGCVGGAFLLDDVIRGEELIPGAQSALFRDTGEVSYAKDAEFMGKTVEELGFPDPEKVRKVFTQKESLFLYNEYSGFLRGNAYNYFMPVSLTEFNEMVYIYAAIPASMIFETVYSILMPIGAALVVTLILFMFLIFYLANSISEPIRELTAASEAISKGDINRKFGVTHQWGEIGTMTRSLYRMVEQFRMYITLQKRSKDLLNIYTRLYETLYQRDSIEDMFDATIFILAEYFKIKNASLVLLKNEIACYAVRYTAEKGLWKTDDKNGAIVFNHHNQIASLLMGRRYIYLNACGISEAGISFIAEDTMSLCILPVKFGEFLRGYFIIEGNEEDGAFVHYDDALIFISNTLSYIFMQKENAPIRHDSSPVEFVPAPFEFREAGDDLEQDNSPAEPEPEAVEPQADLIQAARSIPGLDVDRGLSYIGGLQDQYGELLRISRKVFVEGIQKLRDQWAADLPGFAIGIHGMKGALYNIGAAELGDAAKDLELAAKGGDAAFCQEEYPAFEDRLSALIRGLEKVTRVEAGEGKAGSIPELKEALEKALEDCRNFDAIQAGRIVAPFKNLSWEPEDLGTDVKAAAEALENIDYDEAEILIVSLLKKIQEFENESQSGCGSQNLGGGISA
jgi:HPt (histidine-containing phosphotransfer) domain-containing protein/HAMP domain-containing protein